MIPNAATSLDAVKLFEEIGEHYLLYQLDEISNVAMNGWLRQGRDRLALDFSRYRSTGEPLYIRYMVGVEPKEMAALGRLETELLHAFSVDLSKHNSRDGLPVMNYLNMLLAATYRAAVPDGADLRRNPREYLLGTVTKRHICG